MCKDILNLNTPWLNNCRYGNKALQYSHVSKSVVKDCPNAMPSFLTPLSSCCISGIQYDVNTNQLCQ